jgi:hypothetical protein
MRIFHNTNEITKKVSRLDTDAYSMDYVAGDYLYIASDFPFNHFYLSLGADVNLISASMSIEYYNSGWNSVIELVDDTASLSASGNVEFTPNRNSVWSMLTDSSVLAVGKTLYNKYWMRVSFNATLETVDFAFIGNKFSDDTDLFSEYPLFDDSNFLTSFKTGKTSWEEQHIKAADLIIQDLQKKSVIITEGQILDRKKFVNASVCKVAEILFSSFGNDYEAQRKIAANEYSARLNLSQYSIDTNGNAILDPDEVRASSGWLSR